MKIKTSELSGVALDWAVILCLFPRAFENKPNIPRIVMNYPYSSSWALSGPIIEKGKIGIGHEWDGPDWLASAHSMDAPVYHGPTPLIAAMRCFCCAKLGDEIDIPEELMPCQQPRN